MSVASEINRVKYVSEDFATYRAEADAFFQTYYPQEFNNLIATDLGNALMDQLAFAMQSVAFMMNRRSSELFLSTARLNKSIVKLARMLGYPIKPGSGASCDLTITLSDGPYAFPVTIPVGFKFIGTGGVIYEYRGSAAYVINSGQTVVTIPVKEGNSRRLSFISDGEPNQQFSIFGIPSENYLYSDDMSLTVDGVAWQRSDIIKYESSDIYEILFVDEPPKLRFGDGISGNIPKSGSEIVISCVYGRGSLGSIGQNQITGVVDPLVVNGQVIQMAFQNTVSVPGENPEDISHVKVFASTFFRTQNAAVVKQDYDSIAALESGVATADAQIMRGWQSDIVLSAQFQNIVSGMDMLQESADKISVASVSGVETLGVSGIPGLYVGNKSMLGVSGISYLGTDVSGNVTGINFLGVSGTDVIFVGGTESLGVSGVELLGVSGLSDIQSEVGSGIMLLQTSVSGLQEYLSESFSDTSKANHVQMILLSVDGNNKYISPSMTVINNVQAKLDSLKDAVVTVNVVSGISKIVSCDVEVELGISQTAVKSDVEQKSLSALIGTSTPYGLLVRRTAGVSLYWSDIEQAVRNANSSGDIRFINVKITGPLSKLDAFGNLIVSPQEIVENGSVSVMVKKRFLISGEIVDV